MYNTELIIMGKCFHKLISKFTEYWQVQLEIQSKLYFTDVFYFYKMAFYIMDRNLKMLQRDDNNQNGVRKLIKHYVKVEIIRFLKKLLWTHPG